jgi:hypothetical protein
MGSTAFDACTCGSGLPFARCHGDPANDHARVTALREAEAIAALFPAVRAQGAAIEVFLDEIAALALVLLPMFVWSRDEANAASAAAAGRRELGARHRRAAGWLGAARGIAPHG